MVIFDNSSLDRIYYDLIEYYENSLDTIDFNQLWATYNKNKKNTLKYKFNKPYFAVLIDKPRLGLVKGSLTKSR